MIIISGLFFALLSVLLGAFGAHALKNHLNEYSKMIYDKAILYQMFHSVGLIIIALIEKNYSVDLSIPAWCFILGIFFFSGSLYILSISGIKWLGMITPIGGTLFIVGWLIIIVKLVRSVV